VAENHGRPDQCQYASLQTPVALPKSGLVLSLAAMAPPGTDRRMMLSLLKSAVTRPASLPGRLSPHNIRAFRRFRRAPATCNICGHFGTLLYDFPDVRQLRRHRIGLLRETVRCRSCGAKMRDRTMAMALLDWMAEARGVSAATIEELAARLPNDIRILDTDANGRIARRLRTAPGCTASLYDPDQPDGAELSSHAINVNLEKMPFADETFDIILTTEVMEHVRHIEVAHREIARCLKTSGTYLFTVPYDDAMAATWVLIDPDTNQHLVYPAHIHGDPGMRNEGIKSYRVFGRDIIDDLHIAGLDGTFHRVERPNLGIFGGDLFTAVRR
jgi:hypothetical protein